MTRVNDPTTLESGNSQKDTKVEKDESKVDERISGKSNSQRRPDIDVIRYKRENNVSKKRSLNFPVKQDAS